MFSPSSPAATTGIFRPAPAAETVTALDAGPAPADAGRPSFGDALSAAVEDDEPPVADPHAAASACAPSSEPAAATANVATPAVRKGRDARLVDTGEADRGGREDEPPTVTVAVPATEWLARLVSGPGPSFAREPGSNPGTPEPEAKSTGQTPAATAIHMAHRTAQAGQTDPEAAAATPDLETLSPVGANDPRGSAAAVDRHDTTFDASLKSRAAAASQDLPTAFSASVRQWKDAQLAPASTSAPRAGTHVTNVIETTPNAPGPAATRETAAAMLLQQSLTARMVTAGAGSLSTSTLVAAGLPAETPALPQSVADQMIEAIRLQWTAGGGVARIQIEPVHFGELTVSVRVEQGQVTARLEAASPAVREWLQTNHALLRSGLAEHNLTLGRLDVGEPPETRDAERRRHQEPPSREGRRPRRSPRPDTGELFEIVA